MYNKPGLNNDEDNLIQSNPNNNLQSSSNPNDPNNQDQQNRKKENQRFNIIVRIRPEVEHDKIELTTEDELRTCIYKQNSNKVILTNEKTDNRYEMQFDYVFDEKDNQEIIFNTFGEKLMNDIFRGYNGTVMAYGQTGSGKTYTMFGKSMMKNGTFNKIFDSEKGIVQRAINRIFEYREQKKDVKQINIYVSFMQIYLNQITDLLNEENQVLFVKDKEDEDFKKKKFKLGKDSKNLTIENSLKIGHNKDGKIYVKGLSVKEAENKNRLVALIEHGLEVRRTAETIMNKMSSRSHVILQITVKQLWMEKRKNNLLI